MKMKYIIYIHTTHELHRNNEHNNKYYNDAITITAYMKMIYILHIHKQTTH